MHSKLSFFFQYPQLEIVCSWIIDKTCKATAEPSQASSSETNIVPDSSDTKEAEAAEKTEKIVDVEPAQNNEVSTPTLEEQGKDNIKTVENGAVSKKGKQKARITPQRVKSPPNTRPKPTPRELYRTWLEMGDISDSEDSSDENDESFEAPNGMYIIYVRLFVFVAHFFY